MEVPPIVPHLVGFFAGVDGYVWRQLSGPTGAYWWRVGSSHTQWAPHRGTPPGQGGKEIPAPGDCGRPCDHAGFVPAVHAIQFLDRVPDIPVMPQKRDSTVQFLNKVVDDCCAPQLPMVCLRFSHRQSSMTIWSRVWAFSAYFAPLFALLRLSRS